MRNLKWMFTGISVCFVSLQAFAQAEENKVSFDFAKMTISIFGVFNSNQEEPKNGINAEVKARKNAITSLTTYFKNSCFNSEKGQLGTKSDWSSYFRSQGSEIYQNGVLKVTLSAPIRDILKTPTKRKTVIKTDDGKKIAFSMLITVPGSAIQCGTVGLDLGNNKKVMIYPSDVVKEAIGLTVVKLVYDGKSDLKPATPADMAILQNSTLAKDQNVPAGVIPAVVIVPE